MVVDLDVHGPLFQKTKQTDTLRAEGVSDMKLSDPRSTRSRKLNAVKHTPTIVIIPLYLVASVSLVVVGAAAGPSAAGAECAADVFLPCAFPDADAAIQRFSKVLSFSTVSNAAAEHHVGDADAFLKLEQYLSEAYPKVIALMNDGP
jgi:hypothetical protein